MEKVAIWGDVATWVTGIATIALFVIGFLQIRNERNSRIKRELEVANQTKRSQAEKIAAWVTLEVAGEDGRPYQWVEIINESNQPIYQVIVALAAVGQMGQTHAVDNDVSRVGLVPPGKAFTVLSVLYHGMGRRPGAEIGFHDAAGNKWIRKANGELCEIDISTVEYYEVDLPTDWPGYYRELPDVDDHSYYKFAHLE
jgi:hypothetical protein